MNDIFRVNFIEASDAERHIFIKKNEEARLFVREIIDFLEKNQRDSQYMFILELVKFRESSDFHEKLLEIVDYDPGVVRTILNMGRESIPLVTQILLCKRFTGEDRVRGQVNQHYLRKKLAEVVDESLLSNFIDDTETGVRQTVAARNDLEMETRLRLIEDHNPSIGVTAIQSFRGPVRKKMLLSFCVPSGKNPRFEEVREELMALSQSVDLSVPAVKYLLEVFSETGVEIRDYLVRNASISNKEIYELLISSTPIKPILLGPIYSNSNIGKALSTKLLNEVLNFASDIRTGFFRADHSVSKNNQLMTSFFCHSRDIGPEAERIVEYLNKAEIDTQLFGSFIANDSFEKSIRIRLLDDVGKRNVSPETIKSILLEIAERNSKIIPVHHVHSIRGIFCKDSLKILLAHFDAVKDGELETDPEMLCDIIEEYVNVSTLESIELLFKNYPSNLHETVASRIYERISCLTGKRRTTLVTSLAGVPNKGMDLARTLFLDHSYIPTIKDQLLNAHSDKGDALKLILNTDIHKKRIVK